MAWSVVYQSCYNEDGSPWFPEKLPTSFLEVQKKSLGSYIFANQYENIIIPAEDMVFKPHWKKYYKEIPKDTNKFVFIDPAISLEDHADYTAIVVIEVDVNGTWYVTAANRYRMTPTDIINKIFEIHETIKPRSIGIEEVAYQTALLYMFSEETKRRKSIPPVVGIKPGSETTKISRILSLVPRFEWCNIYLNKGLMDLESELDKFPRAKHDDLLDSLAYMEKLVIRPASRRIEKHVHTSDAGYEAEFINRLSKGKDTRSISPKFTGNEE